MLESQIENYLKLKIKQIGGLYYKFTSPGNAGVPDRLVAYKGVLNLIELKRPGGYLRPLQKKVIYDLCKQDIEVKVLSTKEEVKAYVAELSREGSC